MSDEAIARELKQLRQDFKEDFAEIRAGLGALVSKDVHDAHLGRVIDRVSNVEKDLERLVNAIESDRKSASERRSQDRRMVIGALLAAGLGIIVQILFSTGAM